MLELEKEEGRPLRERNPHQVQVDLVGQLFSERRVDFGEAGAE